MDFKQYYREQELLEFTGENGIANIAKAAGAVVGGAFNLMGAGVKALAGGIAKVMKDTINKIREPLKQKWEAALKLAEEIYPYDKAIYEALKAEKNTAIREIDTYLEMSSKKTLPTKYSVGLDIVYKVYGSTLAMAYGFDKSHASKLSIQTLEEAKNHITHVLFPQMKDSNAVQKYFDENLPKNDSMLRRWIVTGAWYCVWKNKYNNSDSEGMASIVSQIQTSTIQNKDPVTIQERMLELEQQEKEVNIQNLEEFWKIAVDKKMAEVQKIIDSGKTILPLSEEDKSVDQNDLKALVEYMTKATIEYQTLANAYTSFMNYFNVYDSNGTIASYIKDKGQTFYRTLLAKVNQSNDAEAKKLMNDALVDGAGSTLLKNFINLNIENGTTINNQIYKMTPELLKNANELVKVIGFNLPSKKSKVQQPV